MSPRAIMNDVVMQYRWICVNRSCIFISEWSRMLIYMLEGVVMCFK